MIEVSKANEMKETKERKGIKKKNTHNLFVQPTPTSIIIRTTF